MRSLVVTLFALATVNSVQAQAIGPVDGRDLSPTDIDRVAVGTVAPDFTLPQYGGENVTLSQFRGDKNVVLVFYRGFW